MFIAGKAGSAGNGGHISLLAGTSSEGEGGTIVLSGGESGDDGGDILLLGGGNSEGGGTISIIAGDGANQEGTRGGDIFISAGGRNEGSVGDAGSITMTTLGGDSEIVIGESIEIESFRDMSFDASEHDFNMKGRRLEVEVSGGGNDGVLLRTAPQAQVGNPSIKFETTGEAPGDIHFTVRSTEETGQTPGSIYFETTPPSDSQPNRVRGRIKLGSQDMQGFTEMWTVTGSFVSGQTVPGQGGQLRVQVALTVDIPVDGTLKSSTFNESRDFIFTTTPRLPGIVSMARPNPDNDQFDLFMTNPTADPIEISTNGDAVAFFHIIRMTENRSVD